MTFPPGVMAVPFNIPISDDKVLESDEVFKITINISSLPDDVTASSSHQATVTIVEDDCK